MALPRGDEGAHMAALYSSLEALKLLLAESGRCELSAVNNYGETPLHLCAGSGDKNAPKTALLLLARYTCTGSRRLQREDYGISKRKA